jgi:hypothetical protein
VTPAELDELVRRANTAGHDSIPGHYAECVRALVWIADNQSGIWGVRAREALGWNHRPVDRASNAVAARGHQAVDAGLDDALHLDDDERP